MNYTLKGVHAKVIVIWNYMTPKGAGDIHYSIMRGTKANLIIRQGAEQSYKPVLYIEPVGKDIVTFEKDLISNISKVPGIDLKK